MTQSFSGGCACGAIRYEATADPIFAANCYCRDCQRMTGGGFASMCLVPRAAVKVTGEVRFFECTAESGNTLRRGFCPTCGARVLGFSSGFPDAMAILPGSLDDPGWYRPTMNLWTASAQPWTHIDPSLPSFEKNPPM